jgi:hypothetical protein
MQFYCYFVSQSSEFCHHNPLCCFSTSVYCRLFFISLSTQSGNFWIHRRTSVTFRYFNSKYGVLRETMRGQFPYGYQNLKTKSNSVYCCEVHRKGAVLYMYCGVFRYWLRHRISAVVDAIRLEFYKVGVHFGGNNWKCHKWIKYSQLHPPLIINSFYFKVL